MMLPIDPEPVLRFPQHRTKIQNWCIRAFMVQFPHRTVHEQTRVRWSERSKGRNWTVLRKYLQTGRSSTSIQSGRLKVQVDRPRLLKWIVQFHINTKPTIKPSYVLFKRPPSFPPFYRPVSGRNSFITIHLQSGQKFWPPTCTTMDRPLWSMSHKLWPSFLDLNRSCSLSMIIRSAW